MRTVIPIVLFAFQLGAIVYARFVPTRYFCWARYDTQTDYTATATVNGKKLTRRIPRSDIAGRSEALTIARRSTSSTCWSRWNRSRARLGEQATIVMKYRVNGKELREWRWPHLPSAVSPPAARPSWNPLKVQRHRAAYELLIMVKVLALVVLLVNHVRMLPDPWLPFVPAIDRFLRVLFQRTLQVVFVTCALALLFNRRVRLASLVLGSTMLLAVVSSKAYYGNNKTFCGLMFFLTGLYVPGTTLARALATRDHLFRRRAQ